MVGPIVLLDDMERGVVGLVAEIRDVLEEHASPVEVDGSPGSAVIIDSDYELRQVVEDLVKLAVKYGAEV